MSSAPLSIIVDDKRADLLLLTGPSPWIASSEPGWFNGTTQSPTFALENSGKFGDLQLEFHGTAVAFFGVTPPVFPDSQTFLISIDGGSPYNTSYSDPNPQSYRQWYQSPTLVDGSHIIELSHIAGTSLDFAVVTVGNSTALSSETVIVDNDDPGFTFDGTWRRSQDQFNSGPQPDGFPFHNTTHETSTAGSSFTYRFAGTSAAVFGIFTWSNVGDLSLSFTLDGDALSQDYRVNADTPQFVSELGQQQNFLFYSYDFLQSGTHTLTVNVTECVNQTFAFDYLTYKPSFDSLKDMPNLTTSPSLNTTKKDTGMIVGTVAATIALLMLFGLGLFVYLRRRRIRKGRYKPLVYPFVPRQPERTTILSRPSHASASNFPQPDETLALNHRFGTQQGLPVSLPLVNPFEDPRTPDSSAAIVHTTTSREPSSQFQDSREAQNIPVAERGDARNIMPLERPDIDLNSRERVMSMGSLYAETAPPSYEETTRGQPPPTITYAIQR